jgi:hypothetical protein
LLDLLLNLVALCLLDKNDLTVLYLRQIFIFFLTVLILDLEDADRAILGARKKGLIIVADTHLLNRQRVSLNLKIELEGILKNLDTAGFILLLSAAANTTEDRATVVHDDDLLETGLLFKAHLLLTEVVFALG